MIIGEALRNGLTGGAAKSIAAASLSVGGGAALVNSIGNSPDTLPVGCSYAVTVEPGESWSLIGSRHDMSADELAALNDTTIEETIHPKDKICTLIGQPSLEGSVRVDYETDEALDRDGSNCLPDTSIYTIKIGEGPYAAANYFGFSIEDVYNVNPGLKGSTVHPGDVLCSVTELGDLDGDSELSDSQPLTTLPAVDNCSVTADINDDGQVDNGDVRALQVRHNELLDPDITVDGIRGSETNPAIKSLQSLVGAEIDCAWGKWSEIDYQNYVGGSTDDNERSDSDDVRNGCEPYRSNTQIVVCASLGQGDESVEMYQRGDDGEMHLTDSALGRSSRADSDGPENRTDCITPREHVLLDKSAMQKETKSGLKFFIPFGTCGGDGGTGLHFYPNREQWDDAHGCVRLPQNFIENVYVTIKNGGQTEVITRDK